MAGARVRRPRATRILSVLGLAVLVGFVGTTVGTAKDSALPTITYQYGSVGGPPRDVGEVNAAINKLLEPKGFQVRLQPIDYTTYNQKMKLKFAAGERCDLVWTSFFSNDFNQLVANGELLSLEKLLPKYAPKLWKSTPRTGWKAVTVRGQIYAGINQQVWVYPYGAIFRTSALKRFNVDLKKIKSWRDLTPIFAKMKAAGVSPIIFSDSESVYPPHGSPLPWDSVVGYDSLIGSGAVADVRYNDKALRVVNLVTTPGFRASAQLAYEWRQAGYYTADEPPRTVAIAAAKAGKYQVTLDTHADNSNYTPLYGGQWKGVNLSRLFLSTNGIQASLTGVCKSSRDPISAVKFLEELNSNKAIYKLIAHGIEGKHWVWKNKKRNVVGYPRGVTPTNSGYNPNTDWMFGNAFNAPYRTAAAAQIGLYQTLARQNATVPTSVALGFTPDARPITSQLAQLATVTIQCANPLLLGHVNPAEGIPACVKAMNDAGAGKVQAEVQRQLRAWAKRK